MAQQSSERALSSLAAIDPKRLLVRVAIVITLGMLIGSIAATWDETQNGGSVARVPVGTDFATFYGAASLVVDGEGRYIYTPSVLGEKVATIAAYEKDSQRYGHPPFHPLAFVPLTRLPFVPAYVTFVAAGLGFLALMVARVGSVPALAVVGLSLVSIPGFATAQLGQTGFWAAGLLLGVYLALRSGHDFWAGAFLGLLAFKPYYAAGIAIWWLLRPRRFRRSIGGLAAAGAALVGAGFLVPGGWSAYSTYVGEAMGNALVTVAKSGFSLYEMWSLLFPVPLSTVMWLASLGTVLVALRRFLIRVDHQLELSFAAAAIAGILVVTRFGWYDWVLLSVPAALLWKALPEQRDRLLLAGAWLFPVAALSWPIARGLESTAGIFLQGAPLALVLVTWWFLAGLTPVSAEPLSIWRSVTARGGWNGMSQPGDVD